MIPKGILIHKRLWSPTTITDRRLWDIGRDESKNN